MKVFILLHATSANTNSEIVTFVCALPNDDLFDRSEKLGEELTGDRTWIDKFSIFFNHNEYIYVKNNIAIPKFCKEEAIL